MELIEDIALIEPEDKDGFAKVIVDIENMVFGQLLNEPWQDVLKSITEFISGYPKFDNGYQIESNDDVETLSLIHDINYIIIAIRNQSGIDLSYRCEHFHWWEFLLELNTLEERHHIIDIVRSRAYDGDDKERIKMRERNALPIKRTQEEIEQIEEMNDLFYNA